MLAVKAAKDSMCAGKAVMGDKWAMGRDRSPFWLRLRIYGQPLPC